MFQWDVLQSIETWTPEVLHQLIPYVMVEVNSNIFELFKRKMILLRPELYYFLNQDGRVV
jgi:hypothetical protein